MSMIGELFVRVRGDTSDITRKMKGVQDSLTGVERSAKSGHLSLGRLGNQFADLAGRIAGVHPIVGKLSEVLSSFAIGASTTVGVLAGVAAVAVVYDKLTASSRKAMEAGDKLIATYNQAARISALGVSGQQKADIEDINKGLEQHAKWLGFIIAARIQLGTAIGHLGGILGKDPGDHAGQIAAGATALSAAEQQRINALGLQNAKDNEAWAQRIKDANEKAAAAAKKAQADFQAGITSTLGVFDELASHGTKSSVVNARLIDDYQKLAAQIRDMGSASGPAVVELLKLRDALMANLVVAQAVAAANSTGTVGPLVGKTLPGVSITPDLSPRDRLGVGQHVSNVGGTSEIVHVETAIERQTRLDEEHQQLLRDTISNTAGQIASVVGNALLAVGSGRGSQIGAAIGGAAGSGIGGFLGAKAATAIGGAYLGAAVGSVVPVVGTIVGGFIGSAIGSLFGHKLSQEEIWAKQLREEQAHTAWLKANNIVLNEIASTLQNGPAGFKVARYRYDATDVGGLGRSLRRYAARGGVNPLLVGT